MSRRIVPSDEVLYGMKTGYDTFSLIPHSSFPTVSISYCVSVCIVSSKSLNQKF